MNGRSRIASVAARILAFGAALSWLSATCAQTTITYSYDNLQRVIQASAADGSGVEYQYDANGNLVSVTHANPTASVLNEAVDVILPSPGQSATLTFTAIAGQTITLNANSIRTVPLGAVLTFSVYDSSGALVGSTSGSSNAALTLSTLTAGNYSIVITPTSGATGSLELATQAVQAGGSGEAPSGDGPLPPWSYVALAIGLFWIMRRRINDAHWLS